MKYNYEELLNSFTIEDLKNLRKTLKTNKTKVKKKKTYYKLLLDIVNLEIKDRESLK